jgi:hypothetical protein
LRDARVAQRGNRRENSFTARVANIRRMGAVARVEIDGPCRLTAYLLTPQLQELHLEPGLSVDVEIAADALHLVPA